MKLRKSWIVAADVLWGLMLSAMLGLWIAGAAPWHQALLVLAPFGVYLGVRPALMAATRGADVAPRGSAR